MEEPIKVERVHLLLENLAKMAEILLSCGQRCLHLPSPSLPSSDFATLSGPVHLPSPLSSLSTFSLFLFTEHLILLEMQT